MRTSSRVLAQSACFAGLFGVAGCTSVSAGQALTSTIPLSADTERLTYIGEAFGKACQSTVLYFIPIESDSSIFEAKRAALRDVSARYQRQAVALIDVSIDYESTSYLVYERRCTWLRGKALGAETPKTAAAASSGTAHAAKPVLPAVESVAEDPLTPATVDPAQPAPFLAVKHAAVLQCLEVDRVQGGVKVKIKVAATGVPHALAFEQNLAPTTKVCIREALKTVAFPQAADAYEVSHTFRRDGDTR